MFWLCRGQIFGPSGVHVIVDLIFRWHYKLWATHGVWNVASMKHERRSSKSFEQKNLQTIEVWLTANSLCPSPSPVCFTVISLRDMCSSPNYCSSWIPLLYICSIFENSSVPPPLVASPSVMLCTVCGSEWKHVSFCTPVHILLLTRIIKLLLLQSFKLDSHTEGDPKQK